MHHALTILAVDNLYDAATFYRDALGWSVVVQAPVYVEFRSRHGQRLGVYERHGFARNTGELPVAIPDKSIGGTELYFYAEDPGAAFERIAAAGGRVLRPIAPRD